MVSLRFFAACVSWFLASSLLALPVRVELAPVVEAQSTVEAIQGTLSVQLEGKPDLVRPVQIPGETTLDLPARSTARVSIEADGLWASEQVILPVEGNPNVVTLKLLPAGSLQGRLVVPRGHALPEQIDVFFEPADSENTLWEQGQIGPQVRQPCHLAPEGRFECRLPALALDLHLHAPGFVPRYFWNVDVEARSSEPLGEVMLRPGASIVGRVVTADGLPPEGGATLVLKPGISAPQVSERTRHQLNRRGRRGLVDRRGFFQLQDIAPGSYELRVEKSGFAPSVVGPITVYDGRESRIPEPVVLHAPVEFELVVEPPIDPYGRSWKVDLAPVDSHERREEPVPESGRWLQEGLAPGSYRLQIRSGTGRYEYSWWADRIEIRPGMDPFQVDLPVLQVEGEVTLGDEPLESLVWFGGPQGPRQIRIDTDEEGFYAGYLPEEGLWRVTVVSEATGQRNLKPVEIEKLDGTRVARVDLHLPDTRVFGEVVDTNDDPVPNAQVMALHVGTGQDVDYAQSDSDGEFEFRGLAEGGIVLSAHQPGTGKSSTSVQVQAQEEIETPPVRLVLENRQELLGRVVWWGRAVPGAQVLVLPKLPPGAGAVDISPVLHTDAEGRFSLRLSAQAVGANLMILPPGFAAKMVSVALPSHSPIEIEVVQEGGTLVLQAPDNGKHLPGQPYRPSLLQHDGAQVMAETLTSWSRYHGVAQQPGRLVLPMMEPGNYTYCVPDPAGQGPPRCASGFLPPGGELTLQVKEESTPGR